MSSFLHLGERGAGNGAHVITFSVAAECRPVTHFFAVRIEASAWRKVVPSFDFFQCGDEFGVGVDGADDEFGVCFGFIAHNTAPVKFGIFGAFIPKDYFGVTFGFAIWIDMTADLFLSVGFGNNNGLEICVNYPRRGGVFLFAHRLSPHLAPIQRHRMPMDQSISDCRRPRFFVSPSAFLIVAQRAEATLGKFVVVVGAGAVDRWANHLVRAVAHPEHLEVVQSEKVLYPLSPIPAIGNVAGAFTAGND